MERGLYSAATGMSTAIQWLDVVSHNLANVSTTGYKRDVVGFNEGLDRLMNADGGQGAQIGTLGSGPTERTKYTVFQQGAINATGNRTDRALGKPQGMFAVQGADGIKYTRDGAFTQDSQGFLVTQTGEKLLDRANNPIQLKPGEFSVGPEGDITQQGVKVADIAVYDGAFTKAGDSLYTSTNATLMDASQVDVRQGAIEQSNVNAIEEMVAMIKLNRAFEMAQKSATSQDETSGRLIQALQNQ
ncbi:MAG: flagellar hook-basal body protein [Armatimonadota bacterium]